MKKVLGGMSKFIFAGFGIAVLALLMSLTYGALQRLFPNSLSNQMWGLVMFDIAAMCWAIAFVFQSKSVGQYAAAGIGFLVAFIGTLGMVSAEVMLSGQTLTQEEILQIAKWMTYGFIIVTAIHAALVYAHHATGPDIHEQINVGIARGEIVTEAISQATKSLEEQKAALAVTIHNDIVSQVKRDLGLQAIDGTVFDRRDQKRYELNVAVTPEEWDSLVSDIEAKAAPYKVSQNQEGAKAKDIPFSQRVKRWMNSLRQPPAMTRPVSNPQETETPEPWEPERPERRGDYGANGTFTPDPGADR